MLSLLKKYASTNCFQSITFFILIFIYNVVLLSNIFILYQINIKKVDHLGYMKMLNLTQIFQQCNHQTAARRQILIRHSNAPIRGDVP